MMAKHIKARFTDCWYTHEVRNSSSELTFANDIAVCCLNTLATLLNVAGNGFVVYVYLRSRSRQPISNTLLFLLAIFDLLQGILSHPLFITTKILELRGTFVCGLHVVSKTATSVLAGYSSILTSFVLTSERLFAVVYPIRHRVIVRKRWMVTVCLVVFVFWTALFTTLLLALQDDFAVQLTGLSCIIVGLTYSVVVYVKIYCISRRSAASSVGCEKTSGSKVKRKGVTDGGHPFHVRRERPEKPLEFSVTKELKNINSSNNTDGALSQCAQGQFKLSHGHDRDANEWELKLLEITSYQNEVLESTQNGLEMLNFSRKGSSINAGYDEGITLAFDKLNPSEKAKSHCKKNLGQVQSAIQNFYLSHKEKKSILRILCIVGTMFISQLPVIFYFVYVGRHGVNLAFVKHYYPWAKTFDFISTIINPFIYCYKNDHFWIYSSRKSTTRRSCF